MIFTKKEFVKAGDFNTMNDAEIDHFELAEHTIICHFVKNGQNGQFEAKDWNSVKAIWNYRLF